MFRITRWARQYLLRMPSPARPVLSSGFQVLDRTQPIEEERYKWYKPEDYYPVRIGEIFKDRYQVLSKLGYGAYSTVWLCRDLNERAYIALKVCQRDSAQCSREIDVYEYLATLKSSHPGSLLIRRLLDTFRISTPAGSYQCLVHEPLGANLSSFQSRFVNNRMPEILLKTTLKHILLMLDFLHTEAKVIHTDLQPKNIMLAIDDQSILVELDEREGSAPSPRKIDGDRVIHTSQQLIDPKKYGRPTLCDFGEARFGKLEHIDDIQPWFYRAPEVILDLPWNNKVDIWNLGVMTWDLFENKHMFNTQDREGKKTNMNHVAELIALLGPPPADFVNASKFAGRYFDSQGNWIGNVDIPNISLEESEENLEREDKESFFKFMRKMLQWVPDRRQSADELMKDPWLMG